MEEVSRFRLRVLISAYACEPGKGSEPEVGWRWALEMARFYDVTVLTRANNRTAIEEALAMRSAAGSTPAFIYHDLPSVFLRAKKRIGVGQWYYGLWQRSASNVIRRLVLERQIELVHHVTYAGFRYPAAIWGHGVPSIWGPIGGAEMMPYALLPLHYPVTFLAEGLRNIATRVQSSAASPLARRAMASTTVLASTPEMQSRLADLNIEAELMPTIGIDLPDRRPKRKEEAGKLKLLFVGKLAYWKGITLALEALLKSRTSATLTVLGGGRLLGKARSFAQELGVDDRVEFRDAVSRVEALAAYEQFDVFLYPSMHDSGAFCVLEAMSRGLPVICLACGGPALAVADGGGTAVKVTSREKTIEALAVAIRTYDGDRALVAKHGEAARDSVGQGYSWEGKGAQMNEIYIETIRRWRKGSER